MPPSSKSPFRLVVEGTDDKNTIIHLLARHGLDWDAQRGLPHVAQTDGIHQLLEQITVLVRSYPRVGLVLDADESPLDRWHQVRDRLRSAGATVPNDLDPSGLIIDGTRPDTRIGVWLMPDNQTQGTLENFVAWLVPDGDPCWEHADSSTLEARRLGAPCKERDHLKSRLHAWLAWQEAPGNPFGTALKARTFRHDGDVAHRFVAWFHRLFGTGAPPNAFQRLLEDETP